MRIQLEVTTDAAGMVGHAGAALLRELADRLGLTRALGWQQAGARRRHPDAAVLRDLAVMLADGGDCLPTWRCCGISRSCSAPVAWTPDRLAGHRADRPGRLWLARLWAARAHARALPG